MKYGGFLQIFPYQSNDFLFSKPLWGGWKPPSRWLPIRYGLPDPEASKDKRRPAHPTCFNLWPFFVSSPVKSVNQKKKMIPDTSLETSRKPCLSLDLPHFDAPTVGVMLLHSRSRERSDMVRLAWAGDWIRTATACWNTSQPLGTGGSDDHPTDRPGDEKKTWWGSPRVASYPLVN